MGSATRSSRMSPTDDRCGSFSSAPRAPRRRWILARSATAGRSRSHPYPDGQRFARRPASSSSTRRPGGQGPPPMPDWHPDAQEERDAARWPLRLLTAPGYFQSHTAFSGVRSCASAKASRAASCTPTRRAPAASPTGRGASCPMPWADRPGAARQRRGAAGRGPRSGPAAGRRGRCPAPSTCSAETAQRLRRGRDLPEHLPGRPARRYGLTGGAPSAAREHLASAGSVTCRRVARRQGTRAARAVFRAVTPPTSRGRSAARHGPPRSA